MSIISIEQVEQALFAHFRSSGVVTSLDQGRSLDLGCGSNPRNPFNCKDLVGVDVRKEHACVVEHNIFSGRLPFSSHDFMAVTAFDFIEHIPRVVVGEETRFPFVQIMDEIWRLLQPGGWFFSRTPAFPHPEVFQDPTHVNILTENTFPVYFCAPQLLARMYGFTGQFRMTYQGWHSCYLLTLLQKPFA